MNDGYAVFTYRKLEEPVYPCRVVDGPGILASLAFATRYFNIINYVPIYLKKSECSS